MEGNQDVKEDLSAAAFLRTVFSIAVTLFKTLFHFLLGD